MEQVTVKDLSIDRRSHTVFKNGKALRITPTEFNILWLLANGNGRVYTSEEIFETVWGERFFNAENTVMVHIRHLRKKLGESYRNPHYIKTVWGVGYKI